MIDVLNLALPYFGLIFLGFACGRTRRFPIRGLAWMEFFIVYVSLPALFFRILAQTPFEQLNNVPFMLTHDARDLLAFATVVSSSPWRRARSSPKSTIAALAGSYGNIGYMGPGLALATLGAQAAAPVALIFCFDTLLLFSLVPLLMALARRRRASLGATAIDVVRRIVLHPLCSRPRSASLRRRCISSRRSRSTACCSFCRTRRRPARCSRLA